MRVRAPMLLALLVMHVPWAHGSELETAAEKARAAHAAGEGEALSDIANAAVPDAWMVVDALLGDGHVDVAKALAGKRRGAERERLEAYVRWRVEHPARPEVAAALRDLPGATDLPALLERVEALLVEGRGVSHVLLAEAHTGVVATLQRGDVAIGESMLTAAAAAEEIGWYTRAFHAYRSAFDRFYRVGDAERLELVPKALLRLAEALKDKSAASDANQVAAFALHRRGRTEPALEHARRSFDLSQSPLQRRNALRVVLMLQIELGNDHRVLRELDKLKALDQALGDTYGQVITDTQIARYEARLGRSAQAMARIEGVLQWMKRHGSAPDLRGTYLQAATISQYLRDPERALGYIRLARAEEAKAHASGQPYRFDPFQLDKLEALALQSLRRYREAVALNRKVVAGRPGATRATRLFDLLSLAITLAYVEEHEEAIQYFDRAEALLGPELESHIHARFYSVKASGLLLAGKLEEAYRAADQAQRMGAEGLLRESRASSFGFMGRAAFGLGDMERAVDAFDEMLALLLARSARLPDRVGATFRSNFAESIEHAIEAAARTGDPALLYRFAERINAVALRNRLGAADIAESLSPEVRERELVLQEAETQAVRDLRRAKGKDARSAAMKTLGAVREELNRHRERMRAEQVAAAQALDPEIDELEITRERLAPGEVLLLFARGTAHLWALVADREDARIVQVGDRARIDDALATLVLEDPGAAWERDVAGLRTALVKPLKLPAETRHLRVVPAGALAFVPYAVLFEGAEVTLLPSVTAGRLLAERTGGGEGTLAIGDPESADGRRLPGAAKEAKAVGDVVLVGKAATEAAIEGALAKRARWRAVHIACHGLIDPFHPLRSALSLTPADGDDGLWTVSELLRTRVRTDVAVLGSCSTGRGKAFNQEGVLGFVHAFFVAGARQVVVSLWDVEDEATAVLLRRFHEAWREGAAPATALRRAQDHLRKESRWAHPAYWAGWQIWGPR